MSNTRKVRQLYATPGDAHDQAAALDRRYFDAHPHCLQYSRPATVGERRVLSLPPGTRVNVRRLGPNMRARLFQPPAAVGSN